MVHFILVLTVLVSDCIYKKEKTREKTDICWGWNSYWFWHYMPVAHLSVPLCKDALSNPQLIFHNVARGHGIGKYLLSITIWYNHCKIASFLCIICCATPTMQHSLYIVQRSLFNICNTQCAIFATRTVQHPLCNICNIFHCAICCANLVKSCSVQFLWQVLLTIRTVHLKCKSMPKWN